ncbi:hypothetical protein BU15DRAFT_63990 [Melanogaster broomeanus]|nr:hypothetical protein BU15DRAFT_63990 [Melanogaster broomeanus]
MYSFQCLPLLKAPTFCHIQVLLYHFVDKMLSKSYVPLLGLPASPFGFGILPLSPHSDSSDDSVDSEGEEHLSLQGKSFDRGGAKDGNSHPLSSGPLFKARLVYRVLATCIEKCWLACIEKYAWWDCPVAASPLKHKASEDEDDVTPVPKRVARDCVPIIRPGGKW